MKKISLLLKIIIVSRLIISGIVYPAEVQFQFKDEDKEDNAAWMEINIPAVNKYTDKKLLQCLPSSACKRVNPNENCARATGKSCMVKYLSAKEAKTYLVKINSNCLWQNNAHYDSKAAVAEFEKKGGFHREVGDSLPSIWVMDDNGNIYIAPMQYPGHFNHSSLLSGKPVKCAGEIFVSNGEIVKMNNASGHYLPTNKEFREAVIMLKNKGYKKDFDVECFGTDNGYIFESSASLIQTESAVLLSGQKREPSKRSGKHDISYYQYILEGINAVNEK